MTTEVRKDAAQALVERLAMIGEPACTTVSSGALDVDALARYHEVDLRDVLEEVVEAWHANASPAPEAASGSARNCAVNACRAMPFVRLRTARGPRSICLEHWQQVETAP